MKHIKYILFTFVVLLVCSCNDFLDINDNPNAVVDAPLSALLPNTIEKTSQTHYLLGFTTSQLTQQTGSYFDYPREVRMESAWVNLYLRTMSNLNIIIDKAQAESPHYAGVAKVLMAFNLGLATDTWENAPYSEAFSGSENLTPSYDNQESIYNNIINLLDEGIADLENPNSDLSPGADDMAYGGNLDSWIKLAYGLKARYAFHLIDKNGSGTIISNVESSFASHGDDFQINYNEVNFNPWHVNVVLPNNTGNNSITFGSYFVDLLNKKTISANDPRVNVILDLTGVTSPVGITPFDEEATGQNIDFTKNCWYSTATAPVPMITHAELMFIKAQTALISGNNSTAYDAYQAGILSHMSKLGISEPAAMEYINSPAVSNGADNLTMSDILKQKYIALFLNPEAWVDMRKYDYSNAQYNGFIIPDVGEYNGPAQRALYPTDELNRNGKAVEAAQKPYETKMWRDQ